MLQVSARPLRAEEETVSMRTHLSVQLPAIMVVQS